MNHPHLGLARVHRDVVNGETVAVSLVLMRDTDVADLTGTEDEPAEFVTLRLAVDPAELWEPR